jgi:hypothetical protein
MSRSSDQESPVDVRAGQEPPIGVAAQGEGFCVSPEAVGDLESDPLNPFRPLDWRWRRASLTSTPTSPRGRLLDDPWVRRARRYLAALEGRGGGKRRLPRSMEPAIREAQGLRSPRASDAREELEVRLIAGQDDATIAARCGLEPRVVAAYSALFYDVRALLPHSDALLFSAIGPTLYEPDGGGAWAARRLWAYHGGTHAVDALLGRRGDPDAAPGADGPDLESVRAFALLVQVRALELGKRDTVHWLRLWAYVERLDALAPPEPVVAPRTVPRPDLAALKAAVMPPAASDAAPRLGVAG